MRKDKLVYDTIREEREAEKDTSLLHQEWMNLVCVQTPKEKCSVRELNYLTNLKLNIDIEKKIFSNCYLDGVLIGMLQILGPEMKKKPHKHTI